jgi:ribonuclease T2
VILKIIKRKLRDARSIPLCILERLRSDMKLSLMSALILTVFGLLGAVRAAPMPEGQFDYYVLSLSWTPSFCQSDKARAGDECAQGGANQFVVHGLWPQYERGFPSNCNAQSRLPYDIAREASRGLYPTVGLAIHEWKVHGTCTGLTPRDYVGAVREARDKIIFPPLFKESDIQHISPNDVVRAFEQANSGLRAGMSAVTCPRNMLAEVRICLSKDLRGFVPCPDVVRSSCHAPEINVPMSH